MKRWADQLRFLETDKGKMHRSTYLFASFSANPRMLEELLRKLVPNFPGVTYSPDFRQGIAQSWPAVVDNDTMKREIGIDYSYDFEQTFARLIADIRAGGPN